MDRAIRVLQCDTARERGRLVSPEFRISEQIRDGIIGLVIFVHDVAKLGVAMGMLHEIAVVVRVITATVVPPRKCPRCGGKKLDAFPPASAGTVVLDAFGARVISCHSCQQTFLTWRSRRSSRRN